LFNTENTLQSVSRESAADGVKGPARKASLELAGWVFDSLRWTTVRRGVVEDVAPLKSWTHRGLQDIEADLAYLEIHRPDILSALSAYLSDGSAQSKNLDWLFLNVLTYAEYVATASEFRKKLLGIDGYIKSIHPPRSEHVPSVARFAACPWRVVGALVMTGLSALAHPLLALVVASAALYAHRQRSKGIRRLDDVLEVMLRTYLSFNTADLSWSQVDAVLARLCHYAHSHPVESTS
jgi:hypothetical protein